MQPVQVDYTYRYIHINADYVHVKFNKLIFQHNCVNRNTIVRNCTIVHIHLSIIPSIPFYNVPRIMHECLHTRKKKLWLLLCLKLQVE